MIREIRFTLPEHRDQAKALGYACGLLTGIATPNLPPDQLPPAAPIQALGPISTNEPTLFRHLFQEGHGAGLLFGRQASRELARALALVSEDSWFPICMHFAREQMHVPEEEDAPTINPRIHQSVRAFHKNYQEHLA